MATAMVSVVTVAKLVAVATGGLAAGQAMAVEATAQAPKETVAAVAATALGVMVAMVVMLAGTAGTRCTGHRSFCRSTEIPSQSFVEWCTFGCLGAPQRTSDPRWAPRRSRWDRDCTVAAAKEETQAREEVVRAVKRAAESEMGVVLAGRVGFGCHHVRVCS